MAEPLTASRCVYLKVQGLDEAVIMKAPPEVRFARDEAVPVHLDNRRGHVFADGASTPAA